MKNYKAIISALLVAAIVFSFAGCKGKGNTEGETITAAASDSQSKAVTDKEENTVTEIAEGENKSADNKDESKSDNKEKETTKNKGLKKSVKKPDSPKEVTGLKVKEITTGSVTLVWGKTECDGYQVYMSNDGISWSYVQKELEKNTITVSGLTSYTEYYFKVRAYNKNTAGTATSKWTGVVKAKTKASNKERKIKVVVELPVRGGAKDKITISVDGKKVDEKDVLLSGGKYTFTTKKSYKGAIKVSAKLKNETVSDSLTTDKGTAELSLLSVGMEAIDGGAD